jgi:hypothetical protein
LCGLHTLEQAGHVKPEYRWYCLATGELLLTTETVDEAPDDVKCRRCSITHKAATECHVSLIFLPKTSAAASDAGDARGEAMPQTECAPEKYCRGCHGFCPSGVGDNGLCSDCDKYRSPEEEGKRAFARALASRSRLWRWVVRMDQHAPD